MQDIPALWIGTESGNPESETLTVLEAARRAGVTQSAILRWIRNGYLPATPSSNGWQIQASRLSEASDAADEARGTGSVPRKVGPVLQPASVDIVQSMTMQSVEAPARVEPVNEAVLSPLVELIRDQIEVVHDQAEVIGWLQAERKRLNDRLEELNAGQQEADTDSKTALDSASDPVSIDDDEDEVLSWLWKEPASALETSSFEDAEIDDAQQEPAGDDTDVEPPVEEESPLDVNAEPDPFEANPVAAKTSEEDTDEVSLPSWFLTPSDVRFRSHQEPPQRTVPTLSLIVARNPEAENQARQMIDTTEGKIAQLWLEEERLRSARSGATADTAGDDDRGSIWQRIWPLNRRSSV